MILTDFSKSVAQLGDPRFRRVVLLGIGLALALLFGVYALMLGLIQWFNDGSVLLPVLGEVTWVGSLLSWTSLVFMMILSFFLMTPVASAITSMFLGDVAQAVEDEHYPHLVHLERANFFDGLRESVNFLGVLILANVIALILTPFVWFLAPFMFYALNGFLLSREYFQMVALRRLPRAEAVALRKKHQGAVWMAGILMALPLTIPIMNLLVPVIGAATFTHMFHRLNGTR